VNSRRCLLIQDRAADFVSLGSRWCRGRLLFGVEASEVFKQLRRRSSGRVLLARESLQDRDFAVLILALSVDHRERLVRSGGDAETLGARLSLGRINDLKKKVDRSRLVPDVAKTVDLGVPRRVMVSAQRSRTGLGSASDRRPRCGDLRLRLPVERSGKQVFQYAQSGELRGSANQVNVQKSNQVIFEASRGSFLESTPRSMRTKPPDVVVGSPVPLPVG
jgi:hypothetical protein